MPIQSPFLNKYSFLLWRIKIRLIFIELTLIQLLSIFANTCFEVPCRHINIKQKLDISSLKPLQVLRGLCYSLFELSLYGFEYYYNLSKSYLFRTSSFNVGYYLLRISLNLMVIIFSFLGWAIYIQCNRIKSLTPIFSDLIRSFYLACSHD